MEGSGVCITVQASSGVGRSQHFAVYNFFFTRGMGTYSLRIHSAYVSGTYPQLSTISENVTYLLLINKYFSPPKKKPSSGSGRCVINLGWTHTFSFDAVFYAKDRSEYKRDEKLRSISLSFILSLPFGSTPVQIEMCLTCIFWVFSSFLHCFSKCSFSLYNCAESTYSCGMSSGLSDDGLYDAHPALFSSQCLQFLFQAVFTLVMQALI